MIKEKQKLSGNLNIKQSLNCSLNNAVIYVEPITQEKEITPSKQVQEVVPDTGFTGLSKVTVKGYVPNVTNKTITKNGTYKATDDNLDGYSEIEVKTNGIQVPDNAHIVFSDYDNMGYVTKATIKTAWVTGETKYIAGFVLQGTASAGWNIHNVCNNLKEIVIIPNDIKIIYPSAFQNCTSLKTINLPDSITTFNQSIFYNCQQLSNIHLPNSLAGELDNRCFYQCYQLSDITIPVGITSIKYGCFEYCRALTKVNVLGNIVSIGGFCFDECQKLVTFVMSNITQVPTMTGANVFNNTPISKGTGYIYVPDAMVDSFKSATNWSSFADQIKPISEYVEEES